MYILKNMRFDIIYDQILFHKLGYLSQQSIDQPADGYTVKNVTHAICLLKTYHHFRLNHACLSN